MTNVDKVTWIVAKDMNGVEAIVAETHVDPDGWEEEHRGRGKHVEYVHRAWGIYWDGSLMTSREMQDHGLVF